MKNLFLIGQLNHVLFHVTNENVYLGVGYQKEVIGWCQDAYVSLPKYDRPRASLSVINKWRVSELLPTVFRSLPPSFESLPFS